MQSQKQRTSAPLSLRQLESTSGRDLVDRVTDYLTDRHQSAQARLAAETAVFWFARKRWGEYRSQDVRARLHEHAVTRMLSVPLERISAVTACMNRNAHILETLPTWLASKRFEEIIIVDYGSVEPLDQTLAPAGFLDHPSIRLIRVEAQKWCLAEAFNTGLLQARAPFTMKLDADTLMRGMADMSLRLSAQQFRTGNWRTFENNVLNGVVLAPTDAIKKTGGYNEQIRRYGWDDCDFYERLSELALIKTDLVEREFCSLDHSDDERVAHSDALAKANDINRLIQGNRVLTNLLPKWTDKGKRQFAFHSLDDCEQQLLVTIRDFAYTISKIQDDYIYSEDSVYGYNAMLRDIASQISKGSDQQHILPSTERAPIVLMVSLYEDRAETRRREMIRCLRINSQIFDKIIVLYEKPTSIEHEPKISIADELKRLSDMSRCEKQLAEIEIVTISERPAYRDFFEISNTCSPDEQKPWFVIANSDIAFDRSIERIHELDNPDDVLVWLSRWDKCSDTSIDEPSETYLDPEGAMWALIESTINGSRVPNYLSADAWIYKRQPDDWDEYTYRLGTYFCDSFFANRAFRSGRPVINPCRSIRCFHYHDETINSSAQKFEDKGKIELLHGEERERLGGDDPVAGVRWTTLELCNSKYLNSKPYRWNPEGGLWLRLGHVVNAPSTLLVIEAALKATEAAGNDVFISLICDERYKDVLTVVLEFEDYLRNPRLFLDLRTGLFDPSVAIADRPLSFPAECPVCYSNWSLIAQVITAYIEETPDAHHSDRTHLQLLELLIIDELYAVSFLSARYPERFQQQHSEAISVAHLVGTRPKPSSAAEPRFSLISSLFRAKKYLPRLLENYEAIASLGPSELVIVDVNRGNADREIVESFIDRSDYGNTIQYIQLNEDPGIYGCWMKAISMAKSPLVSNFNADDRRSAIHPHILADYLEKNPDVDVCFTALKPTMIANQSWYEHNEEESWFHWYETGRHFTLEDFIALRDGIYCSQNIAHCMPMWRQQLHRELGPIREDKYGTSSDWAFWLECIKHSKTVAMGSSIPLGLYYINPTSHNRMNDAQGKLENKILRDYYGIQQSSFIQQ
jgi:glycosyltransferase involved in cell wall biosynthesis